MYLLFIMFLAAQHSMWDLCLLTRDRPHAPCSGSVESQSLDHQESPVIEGVLRNSPIHCRPIITPRKQ